MTLKKSELRAMLREMLREELTTCNYLTEGVSLTEAPDQSLLATNVAQHPDFETACMTGNAIQIMSIIDGVMQEKNLMTPGAKKLRADVFRMTRGDAKIPAKIGENILFFVWNSRMSGTGYKVI
jgi:hypothetical protein